MLDWLADTLLGRSLHLRYAEIQARQPLYCLGSPHFNDTGYSLGVIGAADRTVRWQGCLVSVEADGLHVYPRTRKMDLHVHFRRDSLRWFGRPEKYQPGRNTIWLHFESGGLWHLLRLRAQRHPMQQFVRALKQIATPEQVKAYRRRRPYVHYGPAPAQTATQDIHGAWSVAAPPLALYLTPCALVELEGDQVRRALPLEQVQQIEVMRRADDPAAGGVVRFRFMHSAEPENIAYTLPDYIPFGAALAEAAKRSLEDPPLFYGKKKDEEDED
jgi:hypothetical protein